jgi:hypothetical protein
MPEARNKPNSGPVRDFRLRSPIHKIFGKQARIL